jgi:hypothetical protein
MKNSVIASWFVGALCCSAPDLSAQTSATWAGSGNWSDPARWSTNPTIPNNGQPGAGDTYNVTIPSGTVNQNLGSVVTVTGFTQNGGTFNGGDLTVLSSFIFGPDFSSPTMAGTGTTTIAAGATGSLGFGSINRSFINHGTLAWTGGVNVNTFTNGATGNVNVTGNIDVTGPVVNQGLLDLNTQGTTFGVASWSNSGTINLISVGGLLLQAGSTTSGSYTVAAGSRLRFTGASNTNTFTSTSSVSGAGDIEFVGGTTIFAGAYSAANTIIDAGTVTFNQTSPVTIQDLSWGGGTINGSADIIFTGQMGAGAGSTLSGSGSATIAAGATAIFSSTVGSMTLNRSLTNQGSLTLGTVTMAGGATITNASGATFTIDQDVARSVASDVVNRGTFVRTGNSTTTFTSGASFTNEGTARVTGGTLTFGGGFTQTAGSLTLEGGNVTGALAINGGTLGGSGTITGNVSVTGGAIQPGLSAGSLAITGNLTLTGASDLVFEIGGTAAGTQFDQLLLTNTVALDLSGSDLVLVTINGFVPTGAQTFTILDSASAIVGAFDSVANGQRLATADGQSFQVNYGAGSAFDPDKVVLSNFASVPEPATWLLLFVSAPLLILLHRRHSSRAS